MKKLIATPMLAVIYAALGYGTLKALYGASRAILKGQTGSKRIYSESER